MALCVLKKKKLCEATRHGFLEESLKLNIYTSFLVRQYDILHYILHVSTTSCSLLACIVKLIVVIGICGLHD